MASTTTTWYYYDNSGLKRGPITGGQLKGLAKQGMITPETMVETEEGKKAPAGKVKGLTFIAAVPAPLVTEIESHEQKPFPLVPEVEPVSSTPSQPIIEIIAEGTAKIVTKQEVIDLAAQGMINSETTIRINGKLGKAGQVKGITFGQPWITDDLFPFSESSHSTILEMGTLTSAGMTFPTVEDAPPFAKDARPSTILTSFPGSGGGLIPAILAGTVVSVVCALLWAGITVATMRQIGWMAVGVGAAVGYSIRLAGRRGVPIYGIIAAGLSMFGCVLGNLLAPALIAANSPEINTNGLSTTTFLLYFFVGLIASPSLAFQILGETFAPIDLLFYGLALYLGFKTALTDMPVDEPPRRPMDGKTVLYWIVGIAVLFLLPVFIGVVALFMGNTGASKTVVQNAQSNPIPYLERRANFTTQLTRVGKAPQEWENDPLPRGVEKVKYPSGSFQLDACLFVPPGGREKKNPALVFFHGGFATGNEEILCCDVFMKAGYVVMAPTLRGENGGPGNFELFLGEVDDAANAVRWLAQQSYVDSERIYTFGHSVGGGISCLLSLMDNVPVKHGGSSGGLYDTDTFFGWKTEGITPFDPKKTQEAEMRLLLGNIRWMKRPHYAYLGDTDFGFKKSIELAKAEMRNENINDKLSIQVIPGDHFTSFDPAIQNYLQVVQQDNRSGIMPNLQNAPPPTVTPGTIPSRLSAFGPSRQLASAVDRYQRDVGQYPTTEQGLAALFSRPADLPDPAKWRRSYLPASMQKQMTTDPWGNPFRYACPGTNGRSYDIWSVGPDGVDGTADDFGHWMDARDL